MFKKMSGRISFQCPTYFPENEVAKCIMCMDHLQNPHQCPQCTKLYCFDCISNSNECPNCKSDLMNVSWVEEIENLRQLIGSTTRKFDATLNKNGECETHGKKHEFYCCDCSICVCDSCIVRGGEHSGHTIEKFYKIYENEMSTVTNALEMSQNHLEDLCQMVPKEMDKYAEIIKKMKEKHVKKITATYESALESLDKQVEEKLSGINGRKMLFSKEMDDLQQKLKVLECQIMFASKSELIMNQTEVLGIYNVIVEKPASTFLHESEPLQFKSYLQPSFTTGSFLVTDFAEFKLKGGIRFSDNMQDDLGSIWRLRVDTNKSDGAGLYLGAYLELLEGVQERYEFCIELIHKIPSKITKIEGEMDFKQNKCWGRMKFIQIDRMISDGYFNSKDDAIEFRFSVRPPTIMQQIRCQQMCIQDLKKKLNSSLKIISK